MKKTKTRFEQLIIQTIAERHGCEWSEAEEIVDHYLPVIRELDDVEGVRIQADRYYNAFRNGPTPNEWLNHIRKTKKKYKLPVNKGLNHPREETIHVLTSLNPDKILRVINEQKLHNRKKRYLDGYYLVSDIIEGFEVNSNEDICQKELIMASPESLQLVGRIQRIHAKIDADPKELKERSLQKGVVASRLPRAIREEETQI